MYGAVGAGTIIPYLVGGFAVSYGVFHTVRNLKVLGGTCAETYVDAGWAEKTSKLIQQKPREGSARKVFMNPISKGHLPKSATE